MDNSQPKSTIDSLQLSDRQSSSEIKILIVDDAESDRFSYKRFIQSDAERSYQIIEAETLEEGLELWRSQQPDVVLLDINLPDGDGLEFLEAISTDQLINKLPVIMLTGSGDERIAVRAMKLGAADYLVKNDVTSVSLLTCIAQVQENNLLIQQLRRSQEQQTVIASMALHIRRAHTFEDVSNTIVQEIRSFLVADRVIIYRFNPDMSGKIVAESVISPWNSCLNAQIEDTCFRENLGGEYQNGKVFAAHDIYEANLTECHIQLLERFQVRANLVAPILLNGMNTLWGLLIVHQCDAPRQWHEEDIQLLQQLSIHLAISLYQAELYQNLENLNSLLEERVQERTKKLQLQSQVLEEIHDGVVTTDLNGIILSWNHGAEQLYGYTEDEVLGRNVAFMYEEAEALGTEVIAPLLDKGSHATEVVIFSKSGKRIYISLRLSVVKDEQCNITHLIGCANDISDRKRAEQKLQQLNQDLEVKVLERTQELSQVNSLQRAILESANYAIISTDLDGIIQTCNHSVERMLGYSASELIGITPKILHDRQEVIDRAVALSAELGQDIPIGFEVFVAKSRLGIASEQEWTYIRKDGSRFPVLLSATALKDDKQKIIGFLGIAKDITERKQAEEALRASERRFASLAAAAPVGIFRINRDNNCTYVNEFWTQITGQEAIVALGYGWRETIHPDDREQIHQQWTQSLIQQAPYQGEGRCIRPDGTISCYYCQALPEIDEDGNFMGYIGTLTDISDRKQAEIQLKHINEELLRATKLKDEFLANMSHELRTPLNSILGLSNALGEQVLGSLNERQLKAIGTVESSGEHLLSLINDILDLSKISSGMMDFAPDGYLVTDLAGKILEANQAIVKLLAIEHEFILSKPLAIFVDPSHKYIFYSQLEYQSSSNHVTTTSEITLINRQGGTFPAEITITKNINFTKQKPQLFWMIRDISDRKRAEQALQELNQSLETKVTERTQELWQVNQLLQTVLDSFPLSVFWKDRQSVCLGCNQLFAMTNGMKSPLEVIGKSTFDFSYTEAEVLAYLADDQQVMESGVAKLNIEETVTLASGEQQWLQTNKIPLRDSNGNVIGVMGTFQDISDRKQAELQLQKTTDRLALALRSGAIGCWEWDIQQNLLVWDDRMYELYGDLKETNSQIPYGIWANAIHPDDRNATETLLQQAVLGQAEYDCEFRVIHPDQSIHFIKAYGKVTRDAQGNAQSMIGVNFDISDRKQAEAQLLKVNDELLRATKLKDEFLANMSHELRTPLNSILGMSESLKEEILGSLNEKQLKAITTVESSGEHLLALINDILDLSKISAGMVELDIESVSVTNLCSSSLVFVKQQAFNKKIQIHSDVPTHINNINVDERRIKQVLINLLTNAVKFTPREGKVNLLVAIGSGDTWQGEATIPQQLRDMNSPTILFQVVDTGIGISAKDLRLLFQPFVQVDSALNRQYEGTGLGLALVKQIVELHGGQVIAESEVGQGSCFTVALPCEMSTFNALSSVPASSTTASSQDVNPDNAPLILLAEDNEANIQTFSSYLTAINYRVIIARNGIEAIAQAKENLPDLILMDVQMPNMDGLEATKQIRLDPNLVNIPIIALTALAMEGDREKCLDAGANEYLAKPIKLRQLTTVIQQILM